MAITNLPTELTSAGNTGTAGDYSSAGTSVFQISYANIGYVPSTTNVYENDFGAELRVFINGIRIYRLSSDTVGTDTSLTTAQKNRLDALNTSYGNQPWTIDSTNSRIQINKDHTVWGDTHTDNCGYPALSAWTIIKVVRIKSDKTSLTTDFQNASVLTEKQLDNAFLETFHIAQEAFDKTASGSLNKDTDDVWDANTTRIKNVSNPVNDQDVATKAWVNSNANTATVAGSIANVNHVAGQISPTNNISSVATSAAAGHIATVAGDSVDIGKVAAIDANVTKVANIDANVTKVADIDTNVTKVADIDDKVTTVAGKETEVGLLGDAGVIEDMGHLGTSANVTAMGHLGTSANVTAMGHLGTSTNVTNMANLNASGVISNIGTVATNIDNVNNFANTYFGAHANDTAVASYISTNSLTLGAGDLYYNTTDSEIKSYDGSSWESMATSVGGNTVTSTSGNNLNLVTPSNSNKVVINSSDKTIQLPNVRAAQANYVLAMSNTSTGETSWQATATAPTITSVSGALNHDQDSTLTLFGSDFKGTTVVSLWNASTGGSKVGSDATITNQTATRLEATFGHGDLTVGDDLYVEADNSGITTRFSTVFVVSADPSITSITGATGIPSGQTSSSHLGTYGGRVANGPQDSDTKLLLNFDRTGGTDIEDSSNIGDDGHKVMATNDAVIKASPFGDGKTAMYFNGGTGGTGTHDHLELDDHADFQFGTGPFTIDFWFRCDDTETHGLFQLRSGTTLTDLTLVKSSGVIKLYAGGTSNQEGVTHGTGIWHHIVVARTGDKLKYYADGGLIKEYTGVSSFDFKPNGQKVWIGTYYSTSYGHKGYIDEFRISKGVDRTVSGGDLEVTGGKYTVPTARYTGDGTGTNGGNDSYTKLLIHSNQTLDSSTHAAPVALNSTTPTTTNGRASWNNSNLYIDGTTNKTNLTVTNTGSDWKTSSGMCIEFWVKAGSAGYANNDYIFAFYKDSNNFTYLYWENANLLKLWENVSGTYTLIHDFNPNNDDYNSSSNPSSADGWSHVAITCDSSGNWNLYTDGYLADRSSSHSSQLTDFTGYNFAFGYNASATSYGQPEIYFEDLRLTCGSTVYSGTSTSSKNFTLPTGPLTTTWSANPYGTTDGSNTAANSTASNVKFLIHGDGAKFTDSATVGTTHEISRTGAYHSQDHGGIAPALTWPASKKLTGSAGIYFDGSSDEVDITASSELTRASNDPFTFECWFYITESGGQTIFESRDSDYSPQSLYINIQTAGWVFVRTNASGGISLDDDGSSGDIGSGRFYPNLNTWYHIAVSRGATGGGSGTGTVMRVYVNGRYLEKATDADLTTTGAHDWSLGHSHSTDHFTGYIDLVRWHNTALYTHETLGSGNWPDSAMTQPTQIYGAYVDRTIPTITFTGQLASGSLESDEDIEFSNVANTSNPSGMQKLDDSKIGLTLTNQTGSDKNKATLTGTISDNFSGTTRANLPVKAQVRTERGNASGTSGEATITFGSGTNTEGLQPGYHILTGSASNIVTEVTLTGASYNNGTVVTFGSSVTSGIAVGMVVFGKGIPNGTTVSTINSGTQITLSGSTIDGSLSSQSLTFTNVIKSIDSATQITVTNAHSGTVSGTIYFGDPERVTIVNGNATSTASDAIVMGTSDPMLTIAVDSETQPTLFNARRYVGTGVTNKEINGFGFEPGLIWIKEREDTNWHTLYDSVRGTASQIYPNKPNAQTTSTTQVSSFNSDGYTFNGSGAGNANGQPMIAWAWKAGGVPSGDGKRKKSDSTTEETLNQGTNSSGTGHYSSTISTMRQSVNVEGDFSITKYTGSSATGAGWIKHGLSGTPDFVIVKNLDSSKNWLVYHTGLGASTGDLSYIMLDEDWQKTYIAGEYNSQYMWTTDGIDSNNIHLNTVSDFVMNNESYVCYAWKSVSGVSKFGSYTGAISSLPTTTSTDEGYCGFKPKFVMIKKISASGGWVMFDVFRNLSSTSIDQFDKYLYANTEGSEGGNSSSDVQITVGDNGFKTDGHTLIGDGSNDYIFAAFA